MSDKVTITLGPGGIKLEVDDDLGVFPRARVKSLRRTDGHAAELEIEGIPPIPIDDRGIINDIAAWIMGGDVPVGEQGKPVPSAGDIGPGSIVDYNGTTYIVSRAGDSSDGIKRWRLSGHTSRGVNESALQLVTPIRVGDEIEVNGSHFDFGAAKVEQVHGKNDSILSPLRWWVHPNNDTGNACIRDEDILRATRMLDDGTILVVR